MAHSVRVSKHHLPLANDLRMDDLRKSLTTYPNPGLATITASAYTALVPVAELREYLYFSLSTIWRPNVPGVTIVAFANFVSSRAEPLCTSIIHAMVAQLPCMRLPCMHFSLLLAKTSRPIIGHFLVSFIRSLWYSRMLL